MMEQTKTHQSFFNKLEKCSPKNHMSGATNNIPRHNNVNITDMIRSLQRSEGLSDCFRRGLADCDQSDCAWRQYCLEKTDGFQLPEKP